MRVATSMATLPVSETAVYGGVTEHANIVHVRTTMCEPQSSPAKSVKVCVVEHSVKTSLANVNVLSSGSTSANEITHDECGRPPVT